MNTALIGGVVGGVIGILGGIVGTYFSIKNTTGIKERAFMIKCCIVCWIAIGLFLGLMFALPVPFRHFLWIPYAVLLPLGITAVNRKQSKIKKTQEAEQAETGNPH